MRILRNRNRREINVLQIRTAVKISIYPIGNKSVQKRHKLLRLFQAFSPVNRPQHVPCTSVLTAINNFGSLFVHGEETFHTIPKQQNFSQTDQKLSKKKVKFTGNLTRDRRLRETIRGQTCADTDNFRLLKVPSFSSINCMKLFTWPHPK